MTSLLPSPAFAPPATRYLASSPESATGDWSPSSTPGRAAAAIFGAPLDITESFRPGARGGPSAIRSMSDVLETYSPVLDRDLEDLTVRDLGDLNLDGLTMARALDEVSAAMFVAANQARLGIMFGGEHTCSLGAFRGIKRLYPEAVILQIDAHLDVRPSYEGQAFTHATWLNHVGQEFGFSVVHQVGLRSGDRAEWSIARAQTAWSSPDLSLPGAARDKIRGLPIYISIDLDVLDPAHAPGTGCPEPGGVTFRELATFLYSLEGLQVVGVDLMEVSPNLDASNITAAAAAKLAREAILLFGS